MLTTARVVKDLTAGGVVTVEDGADVRKGIGLRLAFFEPRAVLRLRSDEADDDVIVFDGALPSGPGRAKLRHQGALSGIAQLREQKLGCKEVDAAFIVNVDDDGFSLLTRCRDELSLIVQRGVAATATIDIDEALLRVTWPGDDLTELPRLWEKLVSLRSGA